MLDKKTSLIKGFTSKDGKVVFEFENSGGKIIGKCPKCGKNVVEKSKGYFCESGKECGFVIWKNICGKSITENEAKTLLEMRTTRLLSGFKSKSGKKFSAFLILKDDDSVGMEFEKR